MNPYHQYRLIQVEQEFQNLSIGERQIGANFDLKDGQTCFKPVRKLVPPKKIQKKYWNQRDNTRYLQFLQLNQEKFLMPVAQRMSQNLNVKMSNFIKYKTRVQCRSHHQKMLIKCRSISGIISFFKRELNIPVPEQNIQRKPQNLVDLANFEHQLIHHQQLTYFPESNWLIWEDDRLQSLAKDIFLFLNYENFDQIIINQYHSKICSNINMNLSLTFERLLAPQRQYFFWKVISTCSPRKRSTICSNYHSKNVFQRQLNFKLTKKPPKN